ncbi:MAG: hypothetical protein KGK02_11405, partial [Rhodospirillales bacterium]|nr:hypothetical protein [Rhodospirillales bacterium]
AVLFNSAAIDTTINLGGTQFISDGGLATNSTIALGGLEVIQQGGTSNTPQINAGGIEIVNAGGTVINPVVQNGGLLIDLPQGNIVGGSAITLANSLIDINKATGNYIDIQNSSQVSIASGHLAVVTGSPSGLENITVASGGTLDVAAGSSLNSVELDGGLIDVSSGSHIGSVTIQIGTTGHFTQAAGKDISTLLNNELRSIPTGTSITVVFNPGDYGAASTILLGSDTSIVGNGSTLGALANFMGPAIFSNYDQRVNSDTWTINNIDGSTSIVQGGIAGGALANVAVTTNDLGINQSTTLNAELPVLNTEYAQSDNSTPIVDTNIAIQGMTLVENGKIQPTGQILMGTNYGSVGRGVWLTDASNVSIDGNVMISGYSGMSLIDDSNIVVSNNIIAGSVVPIDAWSGTSNFVAEDNLLWEYSNGQASGSTGAIQLNASDNAYPSSPGLNNNGTTTNDGLIGNNISGIGSPTAAIAVNPLYPYGPTGESNITVQGNIDNALGNDTGSYFTGNVQNATIADNVYAGGSQKIINTDAAPGTIQTSITTANGVVSGNVVLDNSTSASTSAISNNNINPTTVDNAVYAAGSATAGSISTWGFTGRATSAGNFTTGSSATPGTSINPPIGISTPPYIVATTDTVQINGTLAPIITDPGGGNEISVTVSAIFGTLSSNLNVGTVFHTTANGHDALIIQGSLVEVNQDLASLQYTTNSGNADDAIEISASDALGHSMTHYVPILWNANAITNASLPTTLAAGFIAPLGAGVSLTGEIVIATDNNVINMGTKISAVFSNIGNDTVNAGSGPEYIATGQGTSLINLDSTGDITIAGGAGSLMVN